MRSFLWFALALFLSGICVAQDTNFSVGPQYLITATNTRLLRPIATPSMSLNAGLPEIPPLSEVTPVTNQAYTTNPVLERQPDLFPIYYGYPETLVVELTGESPRQVPASINDTGYVPETNVQSLPAAGYGGSLAEDALYWKSHSRPVVRAFTNADIGH